MLTTLLPFWLLFRVLVLPGDKKESRHAMSCASVAITIVEARHPHGRGAVGGWLEGRMHMCL